MVELHPFIWLTSLITVWLGTSKVMGILGTQTMLYFGLAIFIGTGIPFFAPLILQEMQERGNP